MGKCRKRGTAGRKRHLRSPEVHARHAHRPDHAALTPRLADHALRSGRRTGLVFGRRSTSALDSRRLQVRADEFRRGRRPLPRDPSRLPPPSRIAFDIDVARHREALVADTPRTGRPRGAHDVQIAATSRATGRTWITTEAHACEAGRTCAPVGGGPRRRAPAVAVRPQMIAPAVVGSAAVCLAWNAAIRSAISCAWVASAKWPVSRRWSSAFGTSAR
jgi:predicted nucleic acid-binding protein